MSIGCESTIEKAKELYEQVSGRKDLGVSMDLKEFAQIVNKFIDLECDPVDGVIEAIAEEYDKEGKGQCKYSEIIEFMQKNEWLQADKEAIEKVLLEFKNDKGYIDYVKAIKTLIQD